jgi:hypothetical protein
MSAPNGEQLAGGQAELTRMPAPVLDPVIVRRQEFDDVLAVSSDIWAPGNASTNWEQWEPHTGNTTPRSIVPGLVRIGTVARQNETEGDNSRLPVLIATLGDGNMVIGDDRLATPILPRSASELPLTQQRGAQEKFNKEAADANANRRRLVLQERQAAASIARNLIVRTSVNMAPRTVQHTVYDANSDFHEFADMYSETERGFVRLRGSGTLSDLLSELVASIQQFDLGEAQSLRAMAAETGSLPRIWKLVTLLGGGENLSSSDRHNLAFILQHGPAKGVSVIMHGVHLPQHPANTRRLSWNRDIRQWHTPANSDLFFVEDPAAPPQVAADSTAAALQRGGEYIQRGEATDSPAPPGGRYRNIVHSHASAVDQAIHDRAEYSRLHPLSTPEALRASAEDVRHFLGLADRMAARPDRAAGLMHQQFGSTDGTLFGRARALALFQLVRNLPDTRGSWLTVARRQGAIRQLHLYTNAIAHTVAVTRNHGRHELPINQRAYLAQFQPEEPTPWAFQLTVDAALGRHESPLERNAETRRAVATHLENSYGLRESLLTETGNFADPVLTAAIAECEMLYLYGFETATDPLKNALVWRAQRSLEAVDPEQLPEGARRLYNLAMERLQAIGHKPGMRERLGDLAFGRRRGEQVDTDDDADTAAEGTPNQIATSPEGDGGSGQAQAQ